MAHSYAKGSAPIEREVGFEHREAGHCASQQAMQHVLSACALQRANALAVHEQQQSVLLSILRNRITTRNVSGAQPHSIRAPPSCEVTLQ